MPTVRLNEQRSRITILEKVKKKKRHDYEAVAEK